MTAAEIQQRLVPECYSLPGTEITITPGVIDGLIVEIPKTGFLITKTGSTVHRHVAGGDCWFDDLESACAAIALWMERQEKQL